jgi:hypothetical protein
MDYRPPETDTLGQIARTQILDAFGGNDFARGIDQALFVLRLVRFWLHCSTMFSCSAGSMSPKVLREASTMPFAPNPSLCEPL